MDCENSVQMNFIMQEDFEDYLLMQEFFEGSSSEEDEEDDMMMMIIILMEMERINKMNDEVTTPILEEVSPSDLFLTKEGADVTFEVGGETFPAHRCILAAQSTVFKAELFVPMKEGTTASVIQIKDMEAKVFRAMLSFIYTNSFPNLETDSMEEEEEEGGKGQVREEAMWLQLLLVGADRYDIRQMKLICQDKLQECIDVSTVAGILALAEQHDCPGLKEACLEFLKTPANLQKVLMADGLDHIV